MEDEERDEEPSEPEPDIGQDAPPEALEEARQSLEPVPGATAPLDHVTEEELRKDPLNLAKRTTDEDEEAPGPPG